jgi:methionine synthase II (cobalamin-independent)
MANKLHSAPPFRAEQMGSLLRPDNLLEIREKIANTGISEKEAGLPAVEQEAVRDVVKMQQELGFKAVTSGEYNRTRFWGLMWDEFEGEKRLLSSPPNHHLTPIQEQSVSKTPSPQCSDSTTQT